MPEDQTPSKILQNPKLHPYFKWCQDAIDGSQFDGWVEEDATMCYHNRKGSVTQNVLAGSDFDLSFIYILSGWEGSAADSQIFEYARQKDLHLLPNCYFLADAEFPLCDDLMTLYHGK
ncbi:hypothetical protein Hypma_001555 [Hypsizygus marmoreus]|uniref:DDE Tnp4 domain-containing protein n=1 Tax=Hypsizygus marmoreus TaxID=39966 RepID=A0A369K8T9_HYPMA|nr:hypothetical protein Hypma_001555 [Hypsizygus marmoreus]